MEVPKTRSDAHASIEDDGKAGAKKQKTDGKAVQEVDQKSKKARITNDDNNDNGKLSRKSAPEIVAQYDESCKAAKDDGKEGIKEQNAHGKAVQEVDQIAKTANNDGHNIGKLNGKSATKIIAEYDEFCKAAIEHLSVDEMRKILEANGQDCSGSEDAVVPRCQDLMFYGPLERCPVCGSYFECTGNTYKCTGAYSDWTSCSYTTRDSPREDKTVQLPAGFKYMDWFEIKDSDRRPCRTLIPMSKPFAGMPISLSSRLSRTHPFWRQQIEKLGGTVSNTIPGVGCLVVLPAECERGGSSKIAEAIERGVPVVGEAWLSNSVDKQEVLPFEKYFLGDPLLDGCGTPLDKQDPSEKAPEIISADIKLYGKRCVYKDSKLREQGGYIFEKDGILFNCALSCCDMGKGINDYCVLQLIMVPENHLYLYYKKGRVGDDAGAEERVQEKISVEAIKEFSKFFEELTGNEFEPWERCKRFEKKPQKFFPIDMDYGFDARHGGLALGQLRDAVTSSKLDPLVANLMKVLCSQETYKYAIGETGADGADFPTRMLTDVHLKRCESLLLHFRDVLKFKNESDQQEAAMWADISNRWFSLMPSTRPFTMTSFQELADHAVSVFESVRDMTVASHLIGDMLGARIGDPLFNRYLKLGCSIAPLENDSEDYKMILNYLEKTYEPIKVGDMEYGIAIDNIFAVESSACPSSGDIKKLPNKVLFWHGTRSSNLLRHLHKGFLPAVCSLPVPGYMFGRAIVCSDAAAEAVGYGFSADWPEEFLILAVVSLGDQVIEVSSSPEDTNSLEEKKTAVKGLGKKKPDESQHFVWEDDIKVPCGRLVPSGEDDSPLQYNQYAVYDRKQVCIRFLVGIKLEEKTIAPTE